MMKKALVTLATNHCEPIWKKRCSENWRRWATKNNYSIHCFTQSLDNSPRAQSRSHAWQKLLAMTNANLQKYDYCFWIDSDILINPSSPDPTEKLDQSKIAVTIETGSPFSSDNLEIKQSWLDAYAKANHGREWQERGYFEGWGFSSKSRPLFNTGVIGYNPIRHSEFLKFVYYRWEESDQESLWGEMIPFNLSIQKKEYQLLSGNYNKLAFPISYTWHRFSEKHQASTSAGLSQACHSEREMIQQLYQDSYFLHLAGAGEKRFDYYCHIISELKLS